MTLVESFSRWVGDLGVEGVVLVDLGCLEGLGEGLEEGPIYLWSDEWLERRAQCEGFVLGSLGRHDRRIGARSCVLGQVPSRTARSFLDQYHLQGSNRLHVVHFGLFDRSDLVGLVSLGRHSRQISQNRIVLDRLCFARGVQVVGGVSRLVKACRGWAKAEGYDELISFSDNRLTRGELYRQQGFEEERRYRPDYFYVKDGRRYSKQSQKKSASKCPDSMTELEWASCRGLVRVYDAGKRRWVMNLRPEEHRTRSDLSSERCARMHAEGVFKHAHIRGYFPSAKNGKAIYYGSSFELRCLYLLERATEVIEFDRAPAFKAEGGWRNPDLLVRYADGQRHLVEVKPSRMLEHEAVRAQISDSQTYAQEQGLVFRVWCEKDSGFSNEHEIIGWAQKYLASVGTVEHMDRKKEIRRRISKRYRARQRADTVEVQCTHCRVTHRPQRVSYDKNIARNGRYVCERLGGSLVGSRPKPHLKKINIYASEGRKQCSTCGQVLEIDRFSVRRASWDGLTASCKGCVRGRTQAR